MGAAADLSVCTRVCLQPTQPDASVQVLHTDGGAGFGPIACLGTSGRLWSFAECQSNKASWCVWMQYVRMAKSWHAKRFCISYGIIAFLVTETLTAKLRPCLQFVVHSGIIR